MSTEVNASIQSQILSPGEILLERISRDTDFPTFSKYIIEINRMISSPAKNSSVSDLSNTILKDYALTSKLLKLVNSAYYNTTGGKVTTVTRAVVMLGYEKVRLATTNLLLFDLMKCKSSAVELKEAFVKAFWRGLIAKDMAATMALEGDEEAFICSMLHNLGRHIVLLYLPDKCDEIANLILDKDFSEDKASKVILGISFENLGICVAERWKFPAQIVNSMERLSAEKLRKRKGNINILGVLSNFSNNLCHIINTTKGKKTKMSLSALVKQYARHVYLTPQQLALLIDASLEKIRKHADLLNIDIENSQFLKRLTARGQEQQPDRSGRIPDSDLDLEISKVLVDSRSGFDTPGMRLNDTPEANSVEVILSGIQDMSAAMVGEYKVNDIALMAIESMYRGLGFNRVIFFTMMRDKKQMEARFGFGPGIERIANQVRFEINGTRTIFNLALAKEKDLLIANTDEQHVHNLIPEWFWLKINAPAFVFLPISLEKNSLGAFYADRKSAGPPIQPEQYKFLIMLRTQLLLAIKYRK
jgi:HD-like signal output (HDOD) protein